MFLEPTYRVRMGPPGALHHARFMSKNRYYLRLMLLIENATRIMKLPQRRIDEIKAMSLYISIFHVPKFLSAEKSDIAGVQDLHAIWQMHHLRATMPRIATAVGSVIKSLDRHMWYLDPTLVVFGLANSDMSVSIEEKQSIAKKLCSFDRPKTYDFERKNNTGFMPPMEDFSGEKPPSLHNFITAESWLVFDILEHKREQVKWLLFPPENWEVDPDFQEFQLFVKSIAVVNDAGERAVKAVQETVGQTRQEKKLQQMLVVKGKIKKATGRTKAAYREAADDLTPAEKVEVAFDLADVCQELEVSVSGSEIEEGSSIDFLEENEVQAALLQENEVLLSQEDD